MSEGPGSASAGTLPAGGLGGADAGFGLRDGPHAAVGVVGEVLHRDGAAGAGAALAIGQGQRAVVIDQVGLALEVVDDARVDGVAVSRRAGQQALVGPGPARAGRGGIRQMLKETLVLPWMRRSCSTSRCAWTATAPRCSWVVRSSRWGRPSRSCSA